MGKKNTQIHFNLESELHERVKKEADNLGISVGEFIRICLKNFRVTKDNLLVEKILEVVENAKQK